MKKFFSLIQRGAPLHLFVSAVSFLLLYSRRPDAINNPQFWAEDGVVWYADAYNLSFFKTLIKPEAGYIQTISRLTGEFAQFFPIAYAPLIFNAVALAAQILIVNFLVSKRFAKTVPNLGICLLLGFISLAVPHSSELHANLTNTHWHLAILSFLIIVSYPSDKLSWKIFDLVIVTISSVSGPFSLFLLPVAAIKYLVRREKWTLLLALILAIPASIQGGFIFAMRQTSASRISGDPLDLINIVGGQIFFGGILGEVKLLKLAHSDWRYEALIFIGIIGLAIIIYSLVKAQLELKLFIGFGAAILLSTIFLIDWTPLAQPFLGHRYWYIPLLCYLSTVVYAVFGSKNLIIKSLGIFLMLLLPVGIYNDWRYIPFVDFHFQQFAQEFENAPSGTVVKTKINPDWDFSLQKK